MRTSLAVLTVLSLYAFAMMVALYSFDLPFDEIMRLLVISVGLGWLALLRDVTTRWKTENLQILYFIVYVFILARFHRIDVDVGWSVVAANLLLGTAFLSCSISGLGRIAVSKRDRILYACIVVGGLVVTVSRPLAFGDIDQLITKIWPGVLLICETVIVYFLMSMFTQNPGTAKWGRSLLVVACISFSVAVVVGGWRISMAYSNYSRAVDSFTAGRYSETMHYTQQVFAAEGQLQVSLLSAAQILKTSMDAVPQIANRSEALVAIGLIATSVQQWKVAVDVYTKVSAEDPDYPHIAEHLRRAIIALTWASDR